MSMGVHQVLIDANVMSKFSTRREKQIIEMWGKHITSSSHDNYLIKKCIRPLSTTYIH